MSYLVKDIFYTLQGEGANAGQPAVFCRFAGCNLWSGREQDRATAACRFCDTDFVGTDGPGGGTFASAKDLASAIVARWPHTRPSGQAPTRSPECRLLVVLTGGEPLLQVDKPLIDALHATGFEVAVETNGTLDAPPELDWICVSPKTGVPLVQRWGHELKLVYPQADADPSQYEELDFRFFCLQPMDGPNLPANTQAALRYCLDHPRWRLSLQLHKMLGIA